VIVTARSEADAGAFGHSGAGRWFLGSDHGVLARWIAGRGACSDNVEAGTLHADCRLGQGKADSIGNFDGGRTIRDAFLWRVGREEGEGAYALASAGIRASGRLAIACGHELVGEEASGLRAVEPDRGQTVPDREGLDLPALRSDVVPTDAVDDCP
jgi:hypothetical protein